MEEGKMINLQSLHTNKEKRIPSSIADEDKEEHLGFKNFIVEDYPANCFDPSDYFTSAGHFIYEQSEQKKTIEKIKKERKPNSKWIGAKYKPVVDTETGRIFESVSALADYLGIKLPTLSNKLHKKAGFKYKFLRSDKDILNYEENKKTNPI